MSPFALDPQSELREQLQKFKVAELKALCKQHGIKGYSKAKHSELVDTLLAASETTGVIPTAQPLPSSDTHHVHQSHRHLPPPAVNGFSVNDWIQPSPGLTCSSATPSTTASDMLLVIPTSLTTSLNAIPETRSTRSALPALNPAKQVPIHPPLNAPDETSHGLFSNTTASQNSAKAVEELRDDIQRRQGAVSLKDVVAKQRSKKRLADPSFLTSQENVTKKTTTTGQSKLTGPSTSNSLQLQNMVPPPLSSMPRSINDVFGTGVSTSSSAAMASRSVQAFPRNDGAQINGPGSSKTLTFASVAADYALAPPPGSDSLIATASGSPSKTAHVTAMQNPKETSCSKAYLTRKRDCNRAPVRFSVVPNLSQLAPASQDTSQVPHLPLGMALAASTSETAVTAKSTRSTATRKPKKQQVKNFVAPAFVQPAIESTQVARNIFIETSPCREEPLLSGPAATANNITDRLRLKQDAVERIKKSWLTRFYDQLAAARKDTVARNPNLASSRTPIGLPGMTAEFVHSCTTGTEELDVAVVFVIARLHIQIGTDDWEAIVKDELVHAARKVGGGLWMIVTRTQTREVSKRRGLPAPIKTELATYFVIGGTGEIIAKGDEKALRQDWRLYLSENSNSTEETLMNSVKTKGDIAYPHGIAAGWTKTVNRKPDLAENYRLAEKYVLSNVMPNSYSGGYQTALQMEATWMGQGSLDAQPRKPQINLFLPESHQVECASFVTSGLFARPLHSSIMIVKRKSTEDLVLRETGQIIGNFEEAGVYIIWQTLIGCDSSGVALPESESKRISERFWRGPDGNHEAA